MYQAALLKTLCRRLSSMRGAGVWKHKRVMGRLNNSAQGKWAGPVCSHGTGGSDSRGPQQDGCQIWHLLTQSYLYAKYLVLRSALWTNNTAHCITLHYITSHHITSHHITSHHSTAQHDQQIHQPCKAWQGSSIVVVLMGTSSAMSCYLSTRFLHCLDHSIDEVRCSMPCSGTSLQTTPTSVRSVLNVVMCHRGLPCINLRIRL